MTQRPPEGLADALAAVKLATKDRRARLPASPFYAFASDELHRIESRLKNGPPVDQLFYDDLNIGLMCARELEAVDLPYCQLVYEMLSLLKDQIA